VGDWIVGLSPKASGNRLVYAMKIEEKLTFGQYWNDARFQAKKCTQDSAIGRAGDNTYEPLPDGTMKQHQSWHNHPGISDAECGRHLHDDLSGRFVLASKTFVYFGREARPLPFDVAESVLPIGRSHKCNFSPQTVDTWCRAIEGITATHFGHIAPPTIWDDSKDQFCIAPKKC
jgi:hypothetical protein